MIAVVCGGASSGKSAFAEQLALSLPAPHLYVATMRHGDGETEKRIERHKRQRAGKGFITVELAHEDFGDRSRTGTVLLEDLSNLVLNERLGLLPDILDWENVVVVANELGSDGVQYDDFTQGFLDQVGKAARAIADEADLVVEVVAGCPNAVKGTLP